MTVPALRLELTSHPSQIAPARRAVENFAAEQGFDRPAVDVLGLCVNEAIANVIRHAYEGVPGRPIELTAAVDGDAMVLTLRDWGNGRVPDLSAACTPAEGSGPLRPGGLGLPCLARLLDDVSFQPQPDGMTLRMTKNRRCT